MRTSRMKGRLQRVLASLFAVVLSTAIAACATKQAKEIVAPLPDAPLLLPPPAIGGPGAAANDTKTLERIDALIATNPGPTTVASLHIRQAVIYLDQKQYNRAQAAFESADAAKLVSPRDQALKAVSQDLVWWFRTAPLATIPDAEMGRAQAVMQALKVQIAKRQDSPEIRDYLAEMRAWVGLKYVAALTSRSRQKAAMEDTIDEYATIFTPADLAYLCKPSSAGDNPPLETQRRRLRAEPVIKQAAKYASELTGPNRPTFREPVMQDLIAPASPNPACTGK